MTDPQDRTTHDPASDGSGNRGRPDRIVAYAARGTAELSAVCAAIAASMVLLQLVLHEVIGDRGAAAETALRGLVVSTLPVGAVIVLVRAARHRR